MSAAQRRKKDETGQSDQEQGARRNRISTPTTKTTISVDMELLARIDAYAHRLGISRSALMSIAASMFIDNLLERRRE
jgi:hypothetical protein